MTSCQKEIIKYFDYVSDQLLKLNQEIVDMNGILAKGIETGNIDDFDDKSAADLINKINGYAELINQLKMVNKDVLKEINQKKRDVRRELKLNEIGI